MRSQNNEEALVKQYFRERTGTFIDIGANDGITLSNTYAAAQRGWKGVMVEPSPSVFDKLVSNVQGTDVTCIQAAISDRQGTYNPCRLLTSLSNTDGEGSTITPFHPRCAAA